MVMTSDSRSGVGWGVGFKPSPFHHLIFSDKKRFFTLHSSPLPPNTHTGPFFVLNRNMLVGNAVMD